MFALSGKGGKQDGARPCMRLHARTKGVTSSARSGEQAGREELTAASCAPCSIDGVIGHARQIVEAW